MLTLSEAAQLFNVTPKHIWALENAGLVDALQRDGKGRLYYSERQLRKAISVSYSALEVAA